MAAPDPDLQGNFAIVRTAVRDYFNDHKPRGVQTVYRDMPWWWTTAVNLAPVEGLLYGAMLFVHIFRSVESRITVPAPNVYEVPPRTISGGFVGQKNITYTIDVGIVYRYLMPDELPTGTDESDWVVGLDQIMDSLMQSIREDPNLGDPTVIFQAGQANAGIVADIDLPTINGGYVQTYAHFSVIVEQIVTA